MKKRSFIHTYPILTLNRSRITPWRGNPIFISNIMLDTSDTKPNTSVVTSNVRNIPIREFLSMQKNILSMILCRVPISFMEPWEPEEFLPLRVGFWIKVKQSFLSFIYGILILLILSFTSAIITGSVDSICPLS